MSKKQEALIKIKGIQRAGGDDDVVELPLLTWELHC